MEHSAISISIFFCLFIYCMMFIYSHMPLDCNLPGRRNFIGLAHSHLHLQGPAHDRRSAPICVMNVCPPHTSIHAYIYPRNGAGR